MLVFPTDWLPKKMTLNLGWLVVTAGIDSLFFFFFLSLSRSEREKGSGDDGTLWYFLLPLLCESIAKKNGVVVVVMYRNRKRGIKVK